MSIATKVLVMDLYAVQYTVCLARRQCRKTLALALCASSIMDRMSYQAICSSRLHGRVRRWSASAAGAVPLVQVALGIFSQSSGLLPLWACGHLLKLLSRAIHLLRKLAVFLQEICIHGGLPSGHLLLCIT